jgi:hypothetical protein
MTKYGHAYLARTNKVLASTPPGLASPAAAIPNAKSLFPRVHVIKLVGFLRRLEHVPLRWLEDASLATVSSIA